MPGLTFIHRPGSEVAPAGDVRAALDACRYDERYRLDRLLDRPPRVLVSAAYDAYPVATFETPDHRLVLEGRLYDIEASALEEKLRRLAHRLFNDHRTPVREWLLRTDGPFLFFAEEKVTRRWAFLNDALGRLPTYYRQTDEAFLLSRSFPFFTAMEESIPVDPLGLAQQLLCDLSMGSRTLLEGVRRLQPATLLRGSADRSHAEVAVLHTFNFESRTHRHRTPERNARNLAARFRQACIRRDAGPDRNVLALSGGLDSRAVALAFHQENRPLHRLTFRRHDGSNRRDVEGGEAVGRLCGFTGTTLGLEAPTGEDCRRLLHALGGQNLFDVAYLVDFLEKTLRRFEAPINFLTGDGGGFILPDRRPEPTPRTLQELTHQVTNTGSLPLSVVARLTGVPTARLVESIREHLSTYPETNLAQKYVHFCIFEHLFNFSFLGEDRNRHYVWESAPFYGLPFFRYAMNCPDEQKTAFDLFRRMLLRFSPRALEVGYPNFLGIRMTRVGYRGYAFLRGIVRRLPPLKRFLENYLGRRRTYARGAPLLTCLRRQLETPAVADVLNPRALRQLLEQPEQFSRRAWANLFTVTSLLEWRHGGPQTLDEMADTPLP